MPKKNIKDLHFLPLGGAGEIGMNLNAYAYQGRWLIVDMGITFNDRLGIEVFTPNPQYLLERRDHIDGIFLTHGHEDHIGAIPYLWEKFKCPMYATPFTAELIRYKMQDRQIDINGCLHEVPLEGSLNIGPFKLDLVTLTHSVPEPNGVLIQAGDIKVFHTGDWKLDPTPLIGAPAEEEKLKDIGNMGIDAMVCDSTNVFCEGDSGSEQEVERNLTALIGSYKKNAIFVTCFASNLARLQTVALAAKKHGRQVAILGRGFHRMNEIARKLGYLKSVPPFLTAAQAQKYGKDQLLYLCSGSQGEQRAALSRVASDNHPDVKMSPGDVVIFSSRIIPGNEKSIISLQNKITKQGVKIVYGKNDDIHVSGHPSRNDLVRMYQWIRPNTVIPVHGELIHMVEQGRLAKKTGVPNVVIPENGSLIRIQKEGTDVEEVVPAGRLAVDGNQLISVNHPSLKERMRAGSEGLLSLSIAFNDDNQLRGAPSLEVFGLALDGDFKKECVDDVLYELESLSLIERNDKNMLKDQLKQALQKKVKAAFDKRPAVIVQLLQL